MTAVCLSYGSVLRRALLIGIFVLGRLAHVRHVWRWRGRCAGPTMRTVHWDSLPETMMDDCENDVEQRNRLVIRWVLQHKDVNEVCRRIPWADHTALARLVAIDLYNSRRVAAVSGSSGLSNRRRADQIQITTGSGTAAQVEDVSHRTTPARCRRMLRVRTYGTARSADITEVHVSI